MQLNGSRKVIGVLRGYDVSSGLNSGTRRVANGSIRSS